MLVLLNRERLESALPDVAAAVMMLLRAAHMGIEHPMHPAAQVGWACWPVERNETPDSLLCRWQRPFPEATETPTQAVDKGVGDGRDKHGEHEAEHLAADQDRG